MLLLALTSVDSPSATGRSPVRGFDHHLIKPVDLNQLAILLNEGAEGSQETVHL
jgi:hypothetical protein